MSAEENPRVKTLPALCLAMIALAAILSAASAASPAAASVPSAAPSPASSATTADPLYGPLRLVQEIDCSRAAPPDVPFAEAPAGVSRVETLAGRGCRTMPNREGEGKYFAYRVGKGLGLKAGGCYVLSVEFPDDLPRGFHVLNWGCETARGVATGAAVGDALQGLYVNDNPESLKYPQTGRMHEWRSLFFLHDRFPELARPRGAGPRPLVPADGFWVIVAQVPPWNDPLSAGAAVGRIRLYEVMDFSRCVLKVNFPPGDLPRRRLFWREEMADGVISVGHKPEEKDEKLRGVRNVIDWYEFKARQMQFLGLNTFTKDLLEFGHNQGWDSAEGGGNAWYFQSPTPTLWADILTMLARYKVDVLPYYEYAGSVGGKGLGNQARCRTLAGKNEYTHIKWTEKRNVDVADPEFLDDARKLLDLTIVKYKDRVPFVGAWLRPRPSAIPISFNDNDLKWFGEQAGGGVAPTREQLQADKPLLARYYAWWFGKRRDFLTALRDHLRKSIGPKAVILYTTDTTEPGISLPSSLTGAGQKDSWTYKTCVVNDDVEAWARLLEDPRYKYAKSIDFNRVVAEEMHAKAIQSFQPTWGAWEWQHACPPADPAAYKTIDGVLMTCTFNRLYTVSSAKAFEDFRGPAGLAVVRHYALNENEMYAGPKKEPLLGYFVSDVERAGPHCMLAEARAVAYGDPHYMGYLMGNSYNRGFPEYVRAFNAAFLALPALESVRLAGAASDPDVVVRQIKTPRHGTYLAIVNTAMTEKKDVAITLPAAGRLTDAATGTALAAPGGKLTLSLYSGQLRAVRIE